MSKKVIDAEIISIHEVESTFLNKQHNKQKYPFIFRVNGIEIL